MLPGMTLNSTKITITTARMVGIVCSEAAEREREHGNSWAVSDPRV